MENFLKQSPFSITQDSATSPPANSIPNPNSIPMEGKDVRRRFVQSTLFPHTGNSTKEEENCNGGELDEELCTSGKRRRKAANSKSKPTTRASAKKAIENGKESKQVDGDDTPVPDKSNFFVKASERVQQKGQDNSLVIIDAPDRTDEICSPPSPSANGRSAPQQLKRRGSTPRKERRNSTPSKKRKNGRREVFSGQIPFEVAGDEQTLQTIPDLRLEAKMAAEENSRIFSGRRLHPFFMSWKGGKANQDIDLENKSSPFERKETGIPFNPIHVFENVENDKTSLNWGHWIFSERSTAGYLNSGSATLYEGSIDSLNFSNFLNNSCSTIVSLYGDYHQYSTLQEEVSKELPFKPECSISVMSLALSDERVLRSDQEKDPKFLSKDIETIRTRPPSADDRIEKNDLFPGISCGGSIDSESELQEKLLQERAISHHHACHSQPENCLWTNKYQPQNAKQICGNGESVTFLSEWLHLWHKRGYLARSYPNESNIIKQGIDCDYQQSDSDYDAAEDEDSLKNVLLITGPVGSGKSATIYACARDQGFQVIEINSSDWRNGALVRQKFGEAVESHWLQRTTENVLVSDSKYQSKLFKAFRETTNCSDNKVIEILDNEESQEVDAWSKLLDSEDRTANSQNEIKTLILFEDVDATLFEDHGFITTIQQLAETAKRPMILTSNSDNPVLPKNLDRVKLRFTVPLREELLGLVHLICASEKARIHPRLVEKFVDHCQRDIRKTIMILQFWCQGQTLGEGYPRNEFHTTHSRVLFDLDAGHHTLPKVMCWDYPSKLSDIVSEEIDKSLILMEETYGLMNENLGEGRSDYLVEHIVTQESVPDPVEVKKKAMLRLHCSHDEVECTQLTVDSELFDLNCSPVASPRGKGRRKINCILSSDSEDEVSGHSIPLDSTEVNANVEVLDGQNLPISHHLSTEFYDHSTRVTYHSEVEKSEDPCAQIQDYSTRSTFHSEAQRLEDNCTRVYGHPIGPVSHSEADKLVDHCTQILDCYAGPNCHSNVEKLDHCRLQGQVDYSHTEDYICNSNGISMVPESSFVPETEIINEEELHSVTVSFGHLVNRNGATLVITDQESIPFIESGFDVNSDKSFNIKGTVGITSEPSTACVTQEEIGDSLSKCEADVPRGYQFLDECSRVDCMRLLKPLDNLEDDQSVDFVKETWKNLYKRNHDLKEYVTAEEKTVFRGLKLTCGMSNLISEADLLVKGCLSFVSDFSESYVIPGEKNNSCCYYEDQLEMSSILAQHGMCLYAKEIALLGSIAVPTNTSELASGMLSFSASSAALGKLASMDQRKVATLDVKTPKMFNLLMSQSDSCLSNILKTIIPPRSHLSAKGNAFHEYVSALSLISRFDASRLSESSENRINKRRARAPRHYLSSGSLALASEEILLLGQYNSYQK